MSFEYTVKYNTTPIVDYIITSVRHNEVDDSLVIEYSNGESIKLSLADLVGYEA